MIRKVSRDIWFGDKPSVQEALGEVQAIINVAHSLRRPYWGDLGKLHWNVYYIRMAIPDRVPVTDEYCNMLACAIDGIQANGKFPLLCHCRVGHHRGPTAAFFAYWHLHGRTGTAFREGVEIMRSYGLHDFNEDHPRRIYRSSMLDYCRRHTNWAR